MEYKDFFEKVSGFLKQAEKHKRRGNNDFNPYLQMLSKNDEVKLHSSLIYGFLNPLGNHYQGDVFLETFLECVGFKEWFGDTSNARVYKEYKNIDVYVTNGERHIIVENKIWAEDQPRQIERYIEIIAKEQSKDFNEIESNELKSSENKIQQEQSKSYENIAVVYLAPHIKPPSQQSLGKWQIQGDYLTNGQNQVRFKAISYKNEILKWIENSQAKVGCITNLNAALLFYKDVVQIITKTKENTMSIEHFLTENNMEENMKIVFEILKKKESILDKYYNEIIGKYKKEIEENGFEFIKPKKDIKTGVWKGKKISYPFIIKPKDCGKYYFAFCVEYYIIENRYSYYGVRIFQQDSFISTDDISKIHEYLNIESKSSWWLYDKDKKQRYAFDTPAIELESKLQEFLDSNKIKALNEKLKEYQIFYNTQDEIEKEIKKDYGEYTIEVYENTNAIDIWHKDFNEEELGFNISVWYDSKKHKVCFGIYLEHGANTSAMIARLKEVLGVDDSVFHKDSLDPAKQNDIYINLAQYKEVNVADFTQEKFINFFESVRKQTDSFNQKIKDDLAKGQDSKLRNV